MKTSIRLDLIKLINADTFVAFDDKVRDMMTRAHESNLFDPYIEVNDEYTTYQCFLNTYRLGHYSAADVICLWYATPCLWHDDGVVTGDELPAALAAVEYNAPLPIIDKNEHEERVKEAVDELAICLKSFLFCESGPLAQIEARCDSIRERVGSLIRSDVTPKDRAATLARIAATLSDINAATQSALLAATDWAAQAKATIKALDD